MHAHAQRKGTGACGHCCPSPLQDAPSAYPTPCGHRQRDWALPQVRARSSYHAQRNLSSHIAFKCLYLARIGRPDTLWSGNKLARSVIRWTQACDIRLARLISYIHRTSDYRKYCHVGNAAQHCRLGLFQDSVFAGDLEDSKSTSGRVLCIFGSRTFVPISWMCKKQTSVSHSSTESEIISLDAATQGIPKPTQASTRETVAVHQSTPKIKQVSDQNVDLSNVDQVPSSAHPSEKESQLCIFEDNEAVIKMIIQRQKPDDETRVPHPPNCARLVI